MPSSMAHDEGFVMRGRVRQVGGGAGARGVQGSMDWLARDRVVRVIQETPQNM